MKFYDFVFVFVDTERKIKTCIKVNVIFNHLEEKIFKGEQNMRKEMFEHLRKHAELMEQLKRLVKNEVKKLHFGGRKFGYVLCDINKCMKEKKVIVGPKGNKRIVKTYFREKIVMKFCKGMNMMQKLSEVTTYKTNFYQHDIIAILNGDNIEFTKVSSIDSLAAPSKTEGFVVFHA